MKTRAAFHPLATATIAVTVAVSSPNSARAAAVLVDSVSALNPNPSGLAISEVGNISLAAARILVANAFSSGTGGTVDFQQQFQGGTFPNASSSTNGVDVATDSANPLNVTNFSSGSPGNLVASGTVVFSFYRSDGGNLAGADNIDSNTNQGGNIISGGYKSRDPIAAGTSVTGTVDFTVPPPVPDAAIGTTGVGGGYMGIAGVGSPATLVFTSTPLSFFGITALPRGATRDTLITLTETPIGGGAAIFTPIGASTIVGTAAVFFGQTATPGYEITSAAITGTSGVNRYDDLAFVRSIPEPGAIVLVLVAGLGVFRRRRG